MAVEGERPRRVAGGVLIATGFDWAAARERMVREQMERRGIADREVVAAMRSVPRHEFVPPEYLDLSYTDRPLPIGHEQTISQPYIVAYMTDAAEIDADSRVLEVGTGSGYQTAVLAEVAARVYTIEVVPELARRAGLRLRRLGYRNVRVIAGDGRLGWPRAAPFDAILLTAAPETIPEALLEQLELFGRLVAPVGPLEEQTIVKVIRGPRGLARQTLIPVRFVPMTSDDA